MSRSRLIAMVLVLGTLAVYLPVSHYPFSLYDDSDYVLNNPAVQNGLTWSSIKWAFTTWHAANWHPVTWMSHMLDVDLFGLTNPGAHHVVNVLLHAANTVLLFFLLRRLTRAIWPAAFVAALFAWHPLHVESVAWISERKDVLSTFFALLSLLCYARYAQPPETPKRSAEPKPKGFQLHSGSKTPASAFYWPALLCFALALMSKPMFVTLPFVFLLLDFWPIGRFETQNSKFKIQNLFSLLLEKIPFFVLSTASCAVTFLAQRHGGAVKSLAQIPLSLRLENIPVAYALYLENFFWPSHLAVFYPLPQTIPSPDTAAALLVLAGISVAAWRTRKQFPYFAVGWLWFLGTLLPVIGLVKVGNAALADRYSYFPSIGIFLAVTLGLRDAAKHFQLSSRIIAAGAVITLAACLALTSHQLNFWRDDLSLFSHALAVTKNNDTAALNLGIALERAGRQSEAMADYRQAVEWDPESVEGHVDLANLLNATGRTNEALTEYQTALRLDPNSFEAHDNLGALFAELGQFDDAQKQYSEAARVDPTDWHAPFLMGKLLLRQSRDAEAIPLLQRARTLAPANAHVLNFLAQVFASDFNAGVRNGPAALELAQKANDLTGGIQPDVLDTLAMAYAETGQFQQAQQTAADAIQVATALALTNNAAELSRRLQLYQNHQPFRQSFTNAPSPEISEE